MLPSEWLVDAVMAERRREADQERLARAALARPRRSGAGRRVRLLISRLKPARSAKRRALESGQA
ncbi:MAG TPA: hypothetical protein VFR23_02005 [Jiangellaceae bacterium]|nr:hypothetical protein [Jiangellaceae bacterium]